jgi:ADP-ribosyl-[dinitrogen reductase] hydrolase
MSARKRVDRDRSLGALLGMAVGDALGAPVEGLSSEEIAERHGGRLTEMVGGGVHDMPPGSATDDTEMTICLARALIASGGYDHDAALREYVEWYRTGPVGIGRTVSGVLERVAAGTPVYEAVREQHEASGGSTASNGVLMRTTPIAIAFAGNEAGLRDATLSDAALTHYDPLAGKAALLHNQVVSWLLTDGHARVEQELREPSWLDERLEDVVIPATTGAREHAAEHVRGAGAFAISTVSVALTALFSAPTFEEGLVWAVNLGGDADTNASVAGALLGARHGARAIPARWLDALQRRSDLELLHEHLVALA